MMRGHPSPYALGVQFGSSSIRLVLLESKRRGLRLYHCSERAFPDGFRFQGIIDSHVKTVFVRTLQSLLAEMQLRTQKATVGLDSRAVLLRRIPIDSWLEKDELTAQVMWEAGQLIIDPLDQYVVDFHIQDINETEREVLLAVTRRKTVEDYTEIVAETGLDPVCLDVDLFALSNAYEYTAKGQTGGLTALIDIEPDCVRCVVVRDRVFCFGKMIEISSRMTDITELLKFAAEQTKGASQSPPFAKVVLSGCELQLDQLISGLPPRFCHSVDVISPFQGMRIGASVNRQQVKKAPAYIIGLGLALRGIREA